jgi:hypothetical protein
MKWRVIERREEKKERERVAKLLFHIANNGLLVIIKFEYIYIYINDL